MRDDPKAHTGDNEFVYPLPEMVWRAYLPFDF